jgi:FkbM family methyltransferase
MSSRLPKYICKLGFVDGFKLYIAVKKQKETCLQLSALKHKVWFRGLYSDYAIFEQIFIEQQYHLPLDINATTIFDLGANVGYASIYFANKFPNAKIFALEPETNNHAVAQKNTANYSNITLAKGAVWNKSEDLNLVDNGFGEAGYMVEKGSGNNAVRGYTIDEIMELMNITTIDILKIDIEGAEKEIFETNFENWITNTKVIIVETHDRFKKGTSKAVFNTVGKYDFSLELSGENLVLVNNNLVTKAH